MKSTYPLVFAEYLRELADWRREKAEQYPGDPRNARSARALDDLADHLEASGEVQSWVRSTLEQGCDPPGDGLKKEAIRHGYDFPVKSAEARTDALESMAVEAVIDAYRDVGPQGDTRGLLKPWEEAAAHEGVELERRYFDRRHNMTEAEQQDWIDADRRASAEEGHA